ncbi:hypothetical protein [Streptomyces sp. CB01201]|uniref:hypothetical protein n=1 Tax=Streptomyces sp. CB01201 TaxID=2020324 RepID=UPI001F22B29B|nr:hypothetical protein [Streptomyces sp. CB01201]
MTAAHLWLPVIQAAGFRCQCTGQCGNAHTKGQGRCLREHDQHASKHRGPVHLIAAPADLTLSPLKAARVPLAGLRAWCPDCHTAARRIAQRQPASEQAGLFDL